MAVVLHPASDLQVALTAYCFAVLHCHAGQLLEFPEQTSAHVLRSLSAQAPETNSDFPAV